MNHRLRILLVFLLARTVSFGMDVPPEIQRAAEAGLPIFLSRLPEGMEGEYGFEQGGDMDRAVLGRPFRVAAITPAALSAHQPGDSLDALLTDTTLWYFPVSVEGSIRAVLVVDRTEAGWEAVSLGYARLAAALDQLLREWPEASGYHPRLVSVVQAQQFLFTIPELDRPNLTPLQGVGLGGAEAGKGRAAPRDLSATLADLQRAVERNLSGRPAPGGGRP